MPRLFTATDRPPARGGGATRVVVRWRRLAETLALAASLAGLAAVLLGAL